MSEKEPFQHIDTPEESNNEFMKYSHLFDSKESEPIESKFTYIPKNSSLQIKEALAAKGIKLIDPNEIRCIRNEIEQKLLPSEYVFNIDSISKINVYQLSDKQFRLQIIGKDDNQVVDLRVGDNTSGFEDIPPEWLLRT